MIATYFMFSSPIINFSMSASARAPTAPSPGLYRLCRGMSENNK